MTRAMQEPLILYSTNTWLAYNISELYYGGEHYVWCSPHFDSRSVVQYNYTIPPSSSPGEILRSLAEDVRRGGRHSTKIMANRTGIIKGAHHKLGIGDITDEQLREVISIVDQAQVGDFRPLLYLIPFKIAKKTAKKVPVGERAHPLSLEFRIERLKRKSFDVIELERV